MTLDTPDKPADRAGQRTLLAFDFGTKKIGVAVGQELVQSSAALAVLHSRDERPDWEGISQLIENWQPDALVVGIPLNMDGSDNEMTLKAKRFSNRLHGRYHLPVYPADERLTTREAARDCYDPHNKRGLKRKGHMEVDSVAAQIILETFFSQQS
ncbi:MAG: Holliday junction resolvase RuvX [Thiotrichaceae bacterium]|nr:Holliday junction resolvase RuvX [Thiotrichaceae bacterium]